MKEKNVRTRSIRLNETVAKRLDKVANDLDMSRSAVINFAIVQFLRKQEIDKAKAEEGKKGA